MANEESTNDGFYTTEERIALRNAGRGENEQLEQPSGSSSNKDFQTGIGTDIANFFRVLLAFFAGLWNRDFTDFELLSSTYFPPLPEDRVPKPEDGASETSIPRPPLTQNEVLRQRVDEMRETVRNPQSPQREQTIAELARHYTQGLPPNGSFEQIIEIFLPFEGGLNKNEPFGAMANYGINSKAHPELDVEKLTRAEAIQIYRKDYWDAIKWQINDNVGQQQLSAAVKLIAFDASAQHGLAFSNNILHKSFAQAKGKIEDMPAIMLKMRRDEYARLVRDNPTEYKKYETGWESRMKSIEAKLTALDNISKRFDMRTPTDALIATPPVDIQKYAMNSSFGKREHPVKGGDSVHTGVDISTPAGTPLKAPVGATVAYSGYDKGGYGNIVALHVGGGVYHAYAHLSSSSVKTSQTVVAGQTFAKTGNSGVSTGAHLHYEIWIQRGDVAYMIDPAKATGRNLMDVKVQDELITESQKMAPGYSLVSAIFKNRVPDAIKAEGTMLTARAEQETPAATASGPGPFAAAITTTASLNQKGQ